MFRNILVIFLTLLSLEAYADFEFHWLKSETNQNSALSGKCTVSELESKLLNCSLNQIMVSKPSKEKAENIKQSYLNDISGISNENIEKELFEKQGFNDLCNHAADSEKILDEQLRDVYLELCIGRDLESLKKLFVFLADKEINTCKVGQFDLGRFTFSEVTQNKWVSNNGPSGECGAITVMTLEMESKHLYKYTQEKIYTNKDSELCKNLDLAKEKMIYSWKGQDSIKMECEHIRFGLF